MFYDKAYVDFLSSTGAAGATGAVTAALPVPEISITFISLPSKDYPMLYTFAISGKSFAILYINKLTSLRSKWFNPSFLDIISPINSYSEDSVSNFLILISPLSTSFSFSYLPDSSDLADYYTYLSF